LSPRRVAVTAAGFSRPPHPDVYHRLEERIFETVREVLDQASLVIEDIDAIVISSDDQIHGRIIESMVAAGAVGAVNRDLTTLASAGEHAFVYAYLRVRAGHGRRVLAVSWGQPSESVDPRHVDLVAAEPFIQRPLGITNTVAAGLQASEYCRLFGLNANVAHELVVAREEAAERFFGVSLRTRSDRIVAFPLRERDLPRHTDMVAAMVLTAEEAVTEADRPAWVNGVGWATDQYDLSSRDLSRFKSLELATAMAFAGTSPAASVDVAEIHELSSVAAFIACESLGLAPRGRGHEAALGWTIPVNPSGGNLPFNPGNAAGFMRLLLAAEQVRGLAGAGQVAPNAKRALGATLHGRAGQGAVVVNFGAVPEGR
jgi:acetyl-CoA C-acetyltransferase